MTILLTPDMTTFNDPILNAFYHPKGRLLLKLFGEKERFEKCSEWQMFCAILTDFINAWQIKSNAETRNISFSPSENFTTFQDVVDFSIKLHGLHLHEYMTMPEFILPCYTTPYEICRWHSQSSYKSINHKTSRMLEGKVSNARFIKEKDELGNLILVWKGWVRVFDRDRFRNLQLSETLSSLSEQLDRQVTAGLKVFLDDLTPIYNHILKVRH